MLLFAFIELMGMVVAFVFRTFCLMVNDYGSALVHLN